MSDLTQLTEQNSTRILDLVAELQPATAQQIRDELARHQLDVPWAGGPLPGWLRSGFLATGARRPDAGSWSTWPERWPLAPGSGTGVAPPRIGERWLAPDPPPWGRANQHR